MRLLLTLPAVLLLAACTGGPVTTITITDPGQARISVAAQFTGEAADAITADPDRLAGLQDTVERLTGSSADVDTGDGYVSVSAVVDPDDLADLATITGIGSVTASVSGQDTTITVALVPPDQLPTAISAAVAGRDDDTELAATLAGSATTTVVVEFPDGVVDVQAHGVTPVVTDTAVTVTRAIDADADASFTVTGTSSRHAVIPVSWVLAALGAALGAVVVGILARSRREASAAPSRPHP